MSVHAPEPHSIRSTHSLSETPDPGRPIPRWDTVVIAGGSLAGLLAAAALAPQARRVIVVERDELPQQAGTRSGTPQAGHAHGLLASGRAAIESLLPGISEQLIDAGAIGREDVGQAGRWWVGGGLIADCHVGLPGLALSRPLLESVVRQRVRSLPQVQVRDRSEIDGLLCETVGGPTITGVQVRSRRTAAVENVAADLVVDATGRAARGDRWLAAHNCATPTTERVRVGVRYATASLRATADDLEGRVVSVSAATPQVPRGGVAIRQELDRWIVTLFGYAEDQPPLDPDGFRAYARTLVSPDLAALLDSRDLAQAPTSYRFADCRRRLVESVRLPQGYLAIGDAICSFDPTFGQGMTVAALQAAELQSVMGRGGSVQQYHERAAEIVGRAWALVTGAVQQIPELEANPGALQNMVAGYVRRAQRAARHDPVLAHQLMRVTNLLDPPSAFIRPAMITRVLRSEVSRLRGGRDRVPRQVHPAGAEPASSAPAGASTCWDETAGVRASMSSKPQR